MSAEGDVGDHHKGAANQNLRSSGKRTAWEAILVQPFHSWLSDTTAHGLDRLVGQRPVYVKFFWFVGFCLGLAAFITQVQTFIDTYSQQPETTTLKQNSIEFNFPDVYICNKAIMSGSYPYLMDPTNVSRINNYTSKLLTLLGIPATQAHASFFGRSLLATIPYSMLSDNLGHQAVQFLFVNMINGLQVNQVAFSTFYSPTELNCIRLNISSEQRAILNTVGSYLEIGLFLDVAFFTFPKNTTLLPIPIANQTDGLDFLTWDFMNGVNLESPSGVNVYFASPGYYPDEDSMIQLSAGKDYRINLEISRLTLGKGMSCSSNPDPRRLKSPYDDSETTYPYSESLCRAERNNDLFMQNKGCVSHLLPKDSKFGNATKCLDSNRVFSGRVTPIEYVNALLTDAYSVQSFNQKDIQKYCYGVRPCQADSYTFSYSFGDWPRIFSSFQRQILSRFQGMVQLKMMQHPINRFPGYADVQNVANSLLSNVTTQNIVIGSGYFKDQVMRIRIFNSKSLGSSFQIEKSYDFVNLVSDTGGILGLYLGCSLLTVFEVVELLHDCLTGCFAVASASFQPSRTRQPFPADGRIASAMSRVSVLTTGSGDSLRNDTGPPRLNSERKLGDMRAKIGSVAPLRVTELEL